jgi:hypothetical protein
MANYRSPTVVQQVIAKRDMTELELLILTQVFDADIEGDAVYLCTSESPCDTIWVAADALRAALDDPRAKGSTALAALLDRHRDTLLGDEEVEIDTSCGWWESVLQDIVRRSDTLDHISVMTSFTCDKMRPDGFGGIATLITAVKIRGKSTEEIMAECIAEAVEAGEMKPV